MCSARKREDLVTSTVRHWRPFDRSSDAVTLGKYRVRVFNVEKPGRIFLRGEVSAPTQGRVRDSLKLPRPDRIR